MTTPSPQPRNSAGSCPASSLPPSSSARRHRARVLGLAVLTALFHLYSSGWLSAAAHGLDQAGGGGQPGDDGFRGGAGDDARDWEGAERRRVEGVKALLGIARVRAAMPGIAPPGPLTSDSTPAIPADRSGLGVLSESPSPESSESSA